MLDKTVAKWLAFAACALAVLMVDIDITAVNLALVSIVRDLNINLSKAQWIIDGYLIAAACLMALGGKLVDVYGAKRLFQFGLLFFAITSLAVGLAIGPISIIASRILQGSCIAFTFPVSMVIIKRVFPLEEQGFAVGLVIMIAGLGQALGPTFGGMILSIASWRWIFLLDIPLAAIALIITHYTIPPDVKTQETVNVLGNVLLIFALFALTTPLNEVAQWGIHSVVFWGLLLLAALLFATFIYFESKTTNSVIDITLLLNREFALVNIVRIIFNLIYFVFLFTLGLLLQNIFAFSPLFSGYFMLGLTLVMGVFSIPAGKLVDKFGPKLPMVIGSVLLIISTLMLTLIAQDFAPHFLLTACMISGVAIALILPASGAMALFVVPFNKSGAAMGIFFTSGFIGGALGIGVSGMVLSLISRNHLLASLATTKLILSTEQVAKLIDFAAGGQSLARNQHLFPPAIFSQLKSIVDSAFLQAHTVLMATCLGLALLGLILVALMRIKKPTDTPQS